MHISWNDSIISSFCWSVFFRKFSHSCDKLVALLSVVQCSAIVLAVYSLNAPLLRNYSILFITRVIITQTGLYSFSLSLEISQVLRGPVLLSNGDIQKSSLSAVNRQIVLNKNADLSHKSHSQFLSTVCHTTLKSLVWRLRYWIN